MSKIHIGDMDKESAIKILNSLVESMEIYDGINPSPERINAVKMGIESLEQEPKTGHWIKNADTFYKAVNEKGGVDENTPYFTDDIACPKCLALFSVIDNETERFKYCPNCGCRMESEG